MWNNAQTITRRIIANSKSNKSSSLFHHRTAFTAQTNNWLVASKRTIVTDDVVDNKSPKNNNNNSTNNIPMAGQHQNPIVARLWAAREESKERLAQLTKEQQQQQQQQQQHDDNNSYCILDPDSGKWYGSDSPKTPSESATSIDYPFSTDEFLLESYRSPWDQIRMGRILEDLDALAGNIAFHHVYGPQVLVTAGVDRIRLRKRPTIGHDQRLSGRVTWVGKSSMEIRMICADDSGDDEGEWLEAYFTFVTLDRDTNKPTSMPALIPETAEERAHFELGALKAEQKKLARKNKLQVGQPIMTEASLKLDQMAAKLLEEASPMLRMPSLASPDTILMSATQMQNALMAQPQALNLHGRIFGGFLMRRAFELAFANAYVHGGSFPEFLEVDDISFEAPVNVGDLMSFQSRVLYTLPSAESLLGNMSYYKANGKNRPLVVIEVVAWVTEPENASVKVSNTFHFTFALGEGTTCRRVLPGNIDEARRMAVRMALDKEQSNVRS